MLISDVLYGEYQIDGVLEELINSEEIQRLKDIHMIGPSYLLNPIWDETRFEHSVGVMMLIKKMNGSVEEQIAGLLHDISHTIFSHVIDMVMKREHEDYHEKIKEIFLKNSSIPDILEKWGYNYRDILLDDSKWNILEQGAPFLCADRIDYTLREVYRYFDTNLLEIHDFLANLVFENEQIVLNKVIYGEWFINQYYKVVLELFYDPINMYGYEVMSQILDYSLKNRILSTNDLMKTESEVLEFLQKYSDEKLNSLFQSFFARVVFESVDSNQAHDIFQKKKTRLVDPLVKYQGKIVTTSSCSEKAKSMNKAAEIKSQQGVFLSVTVL